MTKESFKELRQGNIYFNPKAFLGRIFKARDFVKERIPSGFEPRIALTLGSGGLGEMVKAIKTVAEPIPYAEIPGFKKTTIEGHKGNLVIGHFAEIPIIGFQGRRHFYEESARPNTVIALKEVTFPVYVARALGTDLYFATNAAGGLNPNFNTGDLMIIKSHLDIFFPNPLRGPQVEFMDAPRFQAQHNEYSPELRRLLRKAADNIGESDHLHEGVYCALTGPTYETAADSQALRILGVDAVGMSTVPEVIIATNIGMETLGLSLITNVIDKDGTNRTNHEEVMMALQDSATKERIINTASEFFRLLPQTFRS